ncbi:MAG: hypothetical protein IT435_17065 [Phycisphaerales bacterium]|nr:hypothetical protein [Phycisphaerales bacterium]
MTVGQATHPHADQPRSLHRTLRFVLLAVLTLGILALVSSSSIAKPANALGVLWVVLDSGPRTAMYLAACIGWGILLISLVGRVLGRKHWCEDRHAIAVGLGVSWMLTVSHGMGALGAFGGGLGMSGRAWAVAPVVIGLAAAVWPVLLALHRGIDLTTLWLPLHWARRVPIALAWASGACVLFVAACNPPGALWASEFGGYDVLSYHLQLPKEWLAEGVLRPLDHNVYSYLPSYIEAAFLHLGAMTGSRSLLTSDGSVLLSCQLLCAGMTVLAAWMIGRLTRLVGGRCGISRLSSELAGAAISGLVMLVPWMLVVGSLAYNESAQVLLLAAAGVAGIGSTTVSQNESGEHQVTTCSPWLSGILCGWLVGVACGVKPTAIFMGAPAIALAMLPTNDRRRWLGLIIGACIGGVIALSPWLVRNWLASGNPVFPQLASVLGQGTWTTDQIARYAGAHHFDGSVMDRLRLTVFADPSDPSGIRHRGLLHEHWAWFFPAVLVCWFLVTLTKRSHRGGIVIGLALASQLLAWLALTHIQSRFLLPMVVTGGIVIGLAIGIAADARRAADAQREAGTPWPRWMGMALGGVLWALAPASAYTVFRYLQEGQPGVGPNAWLTDGPGAWSGSIYQAEFESYEPDKQREALGAAMPAIYCNLTMHRGDKLYMLGDATPLYYNIPVVYNTTYDTSIFAEAIRKNPDSPGRWIDSLKDRGITHVLVNYSELRRLARSGWLDSAITPEAIDRSIGGFGEIERGWGDRTVVLYRLP